MKRIVAVTATAAALAAHNMAYAQPVGGPAPPQLILGSAAAQQVAAIDTIVTMPSDTLNLAPTGAVQPQQGAGEASLLSGEDTDTPGTVAPLVSLNSAGAFTNPIQLSVSEYDRTIIPADQYVFTGFDVRPNPVAPTTGPSGFTSQSAFDVDYLRQTPGVVGVSSTGAISNKISKVVQSERELQEVSKVSADVKGQGWGFTAEAKFSYGMDTTTKSSTVSKVSYAIMTLPAWMIQDPDKVRLSKEAEGYIATGQIDQFLDIYGTHFVKSRAHGCEMQATYTFACDSVSAKTELAASLQVGYDAALYSAQGTVDTNFNTFGKAGVCTYDGMWKAAGVDGLNPSKEQMDDANAVNAAFNTFEQRCRDSQDQRQSTPLSYVVLGSWWELPAVRAAAARSGSQTAQATLQLYAGLTLRDVEALIQARNYASKAQQAIAKAAPCMAPAIDGPVVQREASLSDGNSIERNDAAALALHQQLQQRAPLITYSNYINSTTLADAARNGVPMTQLVRAYLTDAQTLYADAKRAYRYAWCNMHGIVTSIDKSGGAMTGSLHVELTGTNATGALEAAANFQCLPPANQRFPNTLPWIDITTQFCITRTRTPYLYFVGARSDGGPGDDGKRFSPTYAGPQQVTLSNPAKPSWNGPDVTGEIVMDWVMPDLSYAPQSPY